MSPRSQLPALRPGLTGSHEAIVRFEDTCKGMGIGELELLATPAVLALLEQAAVNAVQDSVEPGLTTVGVRVELEHLLPVAVGEPVRAFASVISVRGRRIIVATKLHDEQERVIGVGRLTRAVVEQGSLSRPAH